MRSLASKLSWWYASSTFLLLVVTTSLVYWALALNFDNENDEYLAEKAAGIRLLLNDLSRQIDRVRWEVEEEPAVSRPGRILARVLRSDGSLVGETEKMGSELPVSIFPGASALSVESPTGIEIRSKSHRAFRAATYATTGPAPSQQSFIIQVAMDLTGEQKLLRRYRIQLLSVVVFGLVLSAFIGNRVAHRGIRPVKDITETVYRIRSSTLHERINLENLASELFSLGKRFNETLDSLEDAFARLSQFSSDIAHELRTPINNMRGAMEVALVKSRSADEYRDVVGSALEECARLSRLIDNLLFLARSEHPETQIRREQLDIVQELKTIRDFYEVAAAERSIKLKVRGETGITAMVDRSLFQRAVGNLVENALRHAPDGGDVVLETKCQTERLEVAVSDNGSGIPVDHLDHVFERFYRVDQGRAQQDGGAGLGLAIVKSVAKLHHGDVRIQSQVGRGTCVTMDFPLA